MGRTSDEEGESLTQTCDKEDSDERPLKKARYIWQIKGKYHLKKPGDEDKERMKQPHPEHTSPPSDGDSLSETEPIPTEQEEEKEAVVPAEAEKDKVEPEVEVQSQATAYEVQQLAEALSSMQLKRWQDRQLARSFVDNTINRIIEVMGVGSLHFDPSEITDEEFPILDNENDDNVEDEAVLMAIHSHGLQRSEQEDQEPRTQLCCDEKMPIVPCLCNQHVPVSLGTDPPYPFHQRPVVTDTQNEQAPSADRETERQEPVLPVSAINSFLNVYPSSAIICNNFQSSNKESPIQVLVKSPLERGFAKMSQAESADLSKNVEAQSQPTLKDDRNSSYFEHIDFLDQAVGVAIQKKGLSTLSRLEFG